MAENQQFLEENDVGLIVKCSGKHNHPNYPRNVYWLELPVNNPALRAGALERIVDEMKEVLQNGKNVIVHCNKSFHRAPTGAAALLSQITRLPGGTILEWNVIHINVPWEFSFGLPNMMIFVLS